MRKDGEIEWWNLQDFMGRTSGTITYKSDGKVEYQCKDVPDTCIVCDWCNADIFKELKPGEEVPVIGNRAHCKACFVRIGLEYAEELKQRRRSGRSRLN